MILFIQLFLAHIIGDFFLQPDTWVRDKKTKKLQSIYLYLHILIHFVLILVIVGIGFWKSALLLAALHFIIDSSKLLAQKDDTARTWFFIDQVLHLATILVIWGYKQSMVIDFHALYDKKILIPATAILFVLNPASYIIKTVISKWTPGPAPAGGASVDESLESAGKLIGMMERLLVLVFVFLGKWEGIGFLLAAKSVFRFGDLKEAKNRKLTEYVLIGTLLSFGMAILTGLAAIKLLG